VSYSGEHYRLPLPDGPGKALKLGFHPPREAVPIYLAAVGPKNLELAGEIADGWLAVFFAPDAAGEALQHIERGRSKRGLGLGVSGPQVSEGWHGVRFDRPLARTREYVAIVEQALSRRRVRFDGEFFTLPLPDGPGKALNLTVHPVRDHIPVYLAAIGPKNLELTGEIADGWLAIFFAPEYSGELLRHVIAGRETAGRGEPGDPLAGFDVVPTVPVVIGPDVEACAAPIRSYSALYLGGMGSREQNFYNALACRMGYEQAAAVVQDRFLARDYQAAEAAVPLEFIDRTSLIGPKERIRERLAAYAEAGVTTLTVATYASTVDERVEVVRTMAELLADSGLGT
jgi:F420-dependent oxidoreductase-like protein